MRAGFVQIDRGPVFPCIIADERWNGFVMPYFRSDMALAVISLYGWNPEEEGGPIPSVMHDGEVWCGVGAGSWIWSEVEGE